MDFELYMNKRELVAIFIDMDPSIFLTDYALPYPAGAPDNNSVIGSNSSNSFTDGSTADVTPVASRKTKKLFDPPRTRFDVILIALQSFVLQKQRGSPNAATSLWFSVYAVRDDVVELLPPTRGCGDNIIASVRNHIRASADLAVSGTTPCGTFPFSNVVDVLRQNREILSNRGSNVTKDGSSGMPAPRTMSGSGMSTLTTPKANGVCRPIIAQGIILLNRDSVMPISTVASDFVVGPMGAVGVDPPLFLDIIPFGNISRPQPSLLRSLRAPRTEFGEGHVDDTLLALGGGKNALTVVVDCPCNVIDLVRFTGVTHRGLAVGCALTRLLTPHMRGSRDFLDMPPLHRVSIKLQNKEAPGERERKHQNNSPPEGVAIVSGGSIVPTKSKPEFLSRERMLLDPTRVVVTSVVNPVGTAQPVWHQPPLGLPPRSRSGTAPLRTGHVYVEQGRGKAKPERRHSDHETSTKLLSGVVIKETPPSTSPGASSRPCVLGVLVDRHATTERKP